MSHQSDHKAGLQHRTFIYLTLLAVATLLSFFGCQRSKDADTFRILSGSENKSLEPIIRDFSKSTGINLEIEYKGSVDIMGELGTDSISYDAVWPAQSLWIKLGDTKGRVKRAESIMTSPVVFGIKKSVAAQLGLIGREVQTKDILEAIQNKGLRFAMTSASQSNSGALAYLGFLNSLAGSPQVLTTQHLNDPAVRAGIKSLLAGVNRASGSSEWLEEMFVKSDLTAMVNYESLIIEANNELVATGKEPLYAIYPRDGVGIADSPFAFVDRAVAGKEEQFAKLQEYLRSPAVQQKLLESGRRTGIGGTVSAPPAQVFNPEWGIDATKIISPIVTPSAQVLFEALRLYQTEFRKPSLTVFCLDYSGSMEGKRSQAVKQAMRTLLDADTAKQYLLQPALGDKFVVIAFSDRILNIWEAAGNNQPDLRALLANIENKVPGGGTDIYSPAMKALQIIASEPNLNNYIPSVVLMTDGESNTGASFSDLAANYQQHQSGWSGRQIGVPIFTILFGEASQNQMEAVANLSKAKVFDGTRDLIDAFKKVRGYS